MKSKILGLLAASALAGLCVANEAVATTIDFDDLGDGVVVGAYYAGLGVTFVDAETGPFGGIPGGSPPRAIVHDTLFSMFGPANSIKALFSGAVSSVSLTGLDVGAAGFVMTAYDALVGGNIVATDSFIGTGLGVGTFHTLSLIGAGIWRVEFSQVVAGLEGDGMALDNLVFDSTVPEPGTLALLGLGLVGLGMSRRKKAA